MEKTKFTNLINNLSVTAEKEKWIPKYNKELDYFYWTKDPLSKDAVLVKVSHEASFYIGPDKKIEGVFVEYVKNNFVEHNNAYKGFLKHFDKEVEDGIYVTSVSESKNVSKYLLAFGEAIRADIYQDAAEQGGKLDLDGLVNFAVASQVS